MLKECTNTPRLLSRVGVSFMAVANDPLPDNIADRWLEATLFNALRKTPGFGGMGDVKIDGDAVYVGFPKKREVHKFRAGPGIIELRAILRWDRELTGDAMDLSLLPWEDDSPEDEDDDVGEFKLPPWSAVS
jgi:hypothetical protein